MRTARNEAGLTEKERIILGWMVKEGHTNKKNPVSPTAIGQGNDIEDGKACNWASPICRKLVDKGLLEAITDKGYVVTKEGKKKQYIKSAIVIG